MILKSKPNARVASHRRVVVGPKYHLDSGLVKSRTQLARLRAQGKLTFFNVGSRLGQWQDKADAELAALIKQSKR
jgi:hypothetical protein